jgi:ABC-type glycerol-3-phosphate transport system substrate-binding protein
MGRFRWMSVGLLVLVLIAASCTSDEGTAAGASGDKVQLKFWNVSEAFAPEYLQALERGFEAEYPNIDLDITNVPEEGYSVKVQTAIAGGKPPDLGFVWDRSFIEEGQVLTLDDLVADRGIDLSTYNQGIVGSETGGGNAEFACSYQGHFYCLGSYTGMVAMFYNKAIFEAAGVEAPTPWPPMTIDAFAEKACALSDPENGVWGAGYGEPMSWLPWEMVVSLDGRTATGVANGPTSVHTHEVLADMTKNGCAPTLDTVDAWSQGVDFFIQEKLAMVITDFGGLTKIENAGVDYGVSALPTPEGVEPFFNVWTDSVGVFAGAEHPEEAMDFIAFQTTEGQRLRAEVTGELPISTQVAEETDWAAGIPGREEALQLLAHARPAVFVPNRWDVYGPIFDAEGLIFGGEQTTEEALDDATAAIQENLDKAWEVYEGT